MLPFNGKYPKLDPKSCLMPGAEIAGDVELKEYASLWQNVAARGDVNKIIVGRYTNVQDNSVLHVDDDYRSRGHCSRFHLGRHCPRRHRCHRTQRLSHRYRFHHCSRRSCVGKHHYPTLLSRCRCTGKSSSYR